MFLAANTNLEAIISSPTYMHSKVILLHFPSIKKSVNHFKKYPKNNVIIYSTSEELPESYTKQLLILPSKKEDTHFSVTSHCSPLQERVLYARGSTLGA